MDLAAHIGDLITVANEMKNAYGIDKKWLNKTIARLEEAQLFATQLLDKSSNAVSTGSPCSCLPGATDKSCPVHMHKVL